MVIAVVVLGCRSWVNDLNGIPVTDPETRFDANGNNIYMPHLRRIDWNYRNNISCAVIIDRSEEGMLDDAEYYVYGGDGMRVRKITENLTDREEGTVEITEKIYLDGCEIKRIHRNDNLVLERISSHISDGTNRIAILHHWNEDASSRETDNISEKKTHYQLSNHLGSSSLEINELGEIISYEEYFPFGGTAFIAGDRVKEVKLKDYRYSGKERDDATGFYYYGYRYYAPWIGNWLSPDPIGPEDSLNLYQFVQNNPVNLVDPNGLSVPGGIVVHEVQVEDVPDIVRQRFQELSEQERREIQLGRSFILQTGEVITLAERERRMREHVARGGTAHVYVVLAEEINEESRHEERLIPGVYEMEDELVIGGGAILVGTDPNEPPASAPEERREGDERTHAPGNSGAADGEPGGSTPNPRDSNASGTAHPSDGSSEVGSTGGANTSESDVRGTGLVGRGPGSGLTGAGRGGGGQNMRPGIGIRDGRGLGVEGRGSGFGISESGSGISGGARRGSHRSDMPSIVLPTTESASESPTLPPEVGMPSQRNRAGKSEHLGLRPTDGSPNAPPGLTINGDDPNGSLDGSRFGTRGSTGSRAGVEPGAGLEGSTTGQQGSHGHEQEGTPTTELDLLTSMFGILNFLRLGQREGESGGVPGGGGWLDLIEAGEGAQIAYIIGSIIVAIITAFLLTMAAIGKAGRAALKQRLQQVWRRVTSRIRRWLERGGLDFSGVSGMISASWEGRWVITNRIYVDERLRGLNRIATWLHEAVHWLINQYFCRLAQLRIYQAGTPGVRGFFASNLRFYEESLTHSITGLVGSFSRQGLLMGRYRNIVGFIPAWSRGLASGAGATATRYGIYHRHIFIGWLTMAIGGGVVIGGTYGYMQSR